MSVPRLRFKDDGVHYSDWQESSLLELSESGFTNGVFNDPVKVGRGYKLINVLDMYIESTIDEKRLFLVELSESEFEKNKAEYGDIFFTRSSLVKEGIAFSNVYLGRSQDVTFDGHLIKMSPRKDLINPIFFNYVLRTSKVRKQLVMRGKTATMTTIGQADIATVNVVFPLLPEQTKIANFLTAIDEKITQLTQKYDLLKQYKKGIMQQIFSQKLRFKDDDGREFPEWEEKKLGDVVDNYGGTALEEFVTEKGTHNFISIGNYEKDGRYFDNGQRIALNEKTKLRLLNAGELVMVLNDKTSSGDLIGSTLLIPEDNKYIYNQRSERLVCKTEIIDSKYAWHLLNSPKFRKLIYSISQGGTQIYVNFPSVKKLNAPIPSLPEQAKIANFLTAIDDKITQTKTQLDAVKLYKKGLLQQLFV